MYIYFLIFIKNVKKYFVPDTFLFLDSSICCCEFKVLSSFFELKLALVGVIVSSGFVWLSCKLSNATDSTFWELILEICKKTAINYIFKYF